MHGTYNLKVKDTNTCHYFVCRLITNKVLLKREITRNIKIYGKDFFYIKTLVYLKYNFVAKNAVLVKHIFLNLTLFLCFMSFITLLIT